jgi:hypothetical protein
MILSLSSVQGHSTLPEKLLLEKLKVSTSVIFTNPFGIVPVIEVDAMKKSLDSMCKLVIMGGTVPVII